MGKASITLSPVEAAIAAEAAYRVQDNLIPLNVVFAGLKDAFDFAGPKGMQGKSGSAFYKVQTGFAAIGRGKNKFDGHALIAVRGTDSAWDWLSDRQGGSTQSSISKQVATRHHSANNGVFSPYQKKCELHHKVVPEFFSTTVNHS